MLKLHHDVLHDPLPNLRVKTALSFERHLLHEAFIDFTKLVILSHFSGHPVLLLPFLQGLHTFSWTFQLFLYMPCPSSNLFQGNGVLYSSGGLPFHPGKRLAKICLWNQMEAAVI